MAQQYCTVIAPKSESIHHISNPFDSSWLIKCLLKWSGRLSQIRGHLVIIVY